ncbi:peptide ABC transporter substrate-binding protein [Planktosalinus lacus]|uniref:Peptide ABC transporter substrate-binding protein n=1 Tax=Planktosalinus lacus TaxID=1526573 RepID=A0A8J2VBP6_9FLAO|nr:peptide ABC transporter substrate-binding protein [Planktosalinus lacus]
MNVACKDADKKNNDHLVFRYNEHQNIASLDPAFARNASTIWATNQLFNGLVQLDDNLNIQPDIAKHWEINDSTLTYTFYLRDDVWFHKHRLLGKDSTRKVIADDFVYSLDRLKDPTVASPGSWVLQNVESYDAINDTILKIKLKQAFPPFMGLLAMRYCSVVPKEVVEHYGNNFRSNPIGTGPFYFKLWEENIKLVFRKNKRYFEKDKNGKNLPYLEAVAITFLPDKQSEFLQFAQGKLDFISGLDASYKDELLSSNGKLKPNYENDVFMIKGPYLNTEFIALQNKSEKNKALQSPIFRKAINYSFDRNVIITYLRNGIGTTGTSGIIPKGLPGYENIDGYNYNPEKALQLLEQYKLETGDQNPSLVLTTDSNYQDIFEYLQREFEKIGIQTTIDVMPSSAIRQARADGSLDAFRSSWIADYPDAESYLSLFYSPNHTPNGPNYTFYENKTYDSLYEHSNKLVDITQRKIIYKKMDSLMIDEAPIVPLFYDEAVRFVRKNVSGLGINPQNFLVLKYVKKEKY